MLSIKLPNKKIEIAIIEIKRVITITDKFIITDFPFFVLKIPNTATKNEAIEKATVIIRGCIPKLFTENSWNPCEKAENKRSNKHIINPIVLKKVVFNFISFSILVHLPFIKLLSNSLIIFKFPLLNQIKIKKGEKL
ncbi:hypothetical protein SAMN05216243_1171 [Sediminibacillus albus]|uniref:Uncharacterized protein n=1 Tax=Sediminibacillus albus TaxID=407036 RepID=A0A1G8X596_9BACI|nr:hypothetical protein SAMN05216243_1171 [Sediminibacillus albus]